MTNYAYQNIALIEKHNKELCKCAECGSKATLAYYYLTDIPYVRCTECNCKTGLCHTPEEAIETWNSFSGL